MIKALIFDVDGTLAETEEAHRQAFNETFKDFHLDWHWSRDLYQELLKVTGGKERMKAYQASLDELGEALSDDEIKAIHSAKTRRYGEILAEGLLPLRDGVRELIEKARKDGLALAVATTTNRPNVDALCQCCWGQDAEAIFDVIAAGDEVDAKKPAPDVYLLALERLGLDGSEAIAFEDSFNGLQSAIAASLQVFVVPSCYTLTDDFVDADWLGKDLFDARLADICRVRAA